jgi:hypothetical protein
MPNWLNFRLAASIAPAPPPLAPQVFLLPTG